MSAVASKNLYDLLGNDPDQDPELRTPAPPVIPIDKTAARTGKRNAPADAPVRDTQIDGAGRGRGGGRGRGEGRGRGRGRGRGSDGAFLDSDAGRSANREKPTEDGFRENDRGSRFRGEGGRGRGRGRGGGRGGRDDRHSHTVHDGGPDDQAKQAAQGWGGNTGNDEWADESAGQAIADEEKKDEPVWNAGAPADAGGDQFGDGADQFGSSGVDQFGETPAAQNGAPAAEPEPEDNSKSYADYLAEQAEKKLQLGGVLQARQANEGASKDQPEGKKVERQETDFFAGSGPKSGRQRERKTKETYLLDHDFGPQQQDSGFRGGRGRGRGEGRGRGRGEGGFRGDRGDRGEGRSRGFGRGRGGDGEYRARGGRGGGRGGAGAAQPNFSSPQDFPGLGGS